MSGKDLWECGECGRLYEASRTARRHWNDARAAGRGHQGACDIFHRPGTAPVSLSSAPASVPPPPIPHPHPSPMVMAATMTTTPAAIAAAALVSTNIDTESSVSLPRLREESERGNSFGELLRAVHLQFAIPPQPQLLLTGYQGGPAVFDVPLTCQSFVNANRPSVFGAFSLWW